MSAARTAENRMIVRDKLRTDLRQCLPDEILNSIINDENIAFIAVESLDISEVTGSAIRITQAVEFLHINAVPLTKEVCQHVIQSHGCLDFADALLFLHRNGILLHNDVLKACRRHEEYDDPLSIEIAKAIVFLAKNNVTLTAKILSSLINEPKKLSMAFWCLHANGISVTNDIIKTFLRLKKVERFDMVEELAQVMVLLNTNEIPLDSTILRFFTYGWYNVRVPLFPLETAHALSLLHNLGITFTEHPDTDISLFYGWTKEKLTLKKLKKLGNYMLCLDKAGALTKETIRHTVQFYNNSDELLTRFTDINKLIEASDTEKVEEVEKHAAPLPPPLMKIVYSFFHYKNPTLKAEEVKKQSSPSLPNKENEQKKSFRCANHNAQ